MFICNCGTVLNEKDDAEILFYDGENNEVHVSILLPCAGCTRIVKWRAGPLIRLDSELIE